MKNPITRRKSARYFDYYNADIKITNAKEIDRINKLVIPPAWQDVQISSSKTAKIQATGRDKAGRQQSIYSPAFRANQEKLKFDKILRFAVALPKLRIQIEKDLKRKRLSREKVLGCIVKLIDQTYIRVGSEQYARDHKTYGITTLRSKHLQKESTTVSFDFIGKSGKEHHKTITDPELVRLIKQLDEIPGYEIFRYEDSKGAVHDLHAHDVNEYIKQYMGEEYTAKDFRTWGGTLLACSEVIADELDETASQSARKKSVTAIIKKVAEQLGNTPSVARGSYVDPRVIAAYESHHTIQKIRVAMKSMKPKKYMSIEEQCLLKMLSES